MVISGAPLSSSLGSIERLHLGSPQLFSRNAMLWHPHCALLRQGDGGRRDQCCGCLLGPWGDSTLQLVFRRVAEAHQKRDWFCAVPAVSVGAENQTRAKVISLCAVNSSQTP